MSQMKMTLTHSELFEYVCASPVTHVWCVILEGHLAQGLE